MPIASACGATGIRLALILTLVLVGAAADAAEQALEPPADATSAEHDDGRRTIGRLPANLGRGFVGVFNRDNLVPLLAGGAATAVAFAFDGDVQKAYQQQGWSDTLEDVGGGVYSAVFVAGMFTAGRFSRETRFRAMTYDLLDAAVVNATYTGILKLVAGRERPNGENNKSFPSGHTSNAFAMAAVAEGHYGWKVGVPAYAFAGLVGASRVHRNKHYLSDVVAGAALGYIVGRTVVRENSHPLEKGRHVAWNLTPLLSRQARGVQVTVIF
jgi:membrane-associated phospholipid phosphatase